ncbi:MAG: SprT family zinc-dependent metalloprotease [Cyanobacteria bacterium]|nr:SprT family zinc-dependent metalloprotease [Cyanobacteriota bacterium]
MPLEPLLPLFHRLNREHFDGVLVRSGKPVADLRWSDGKLTRTAGLYRRGRRTDGQGFREIVLSRPLLEPLPRQATLSTLAHEMIHAWVDQILGVREAHGPHFKACMARINQAQDEFEVNLRHGFPVPVRAARWLACCPRCGLRTPYRTRRKGLACRPCCGTFFGGRWDSSCLLVFESQLDRPSHPE